MKKDKVVVSGINGFVGRHLARELYGAGLSVIGVGREPDVNPELSDVVDEYHQADLTKQWPETSKARAIIHLAGLAAVGPSFNNPQLYFDVNTSMINRLCEYYLDESRKDNENPRIVIVSSGSIYDSSQPMPISEDGVIKTDPYPSPYAESKVESERLAAKYCKKGLDCVVARPFNHIGPGQAPGFLLPDLYEKLRDAANQNASVIKIGNLESRRDFTDVRDVVIAYIMIALAKSLRHRVYNICSGKSYPGTEILDALIELTESDSMTYEIDPDLFRRNDAKNIVGDPKRIRDELGWKPRISIRQTINDFVEFESKA